MKFEELHTQRLNLRKISEETYNEIFSSLNEEEIISVLGLASKKEFQIEKEKFEKGHTTHNKKILYFQLIEKTSLKIIGWCGYHTWYIDHKRAEIGYGLFDDSLKNKGVMTEAMVAIIDYGFDEMQLNRIEAFVGSTNVPSLKLLKKFNFVEEGKMREHYISNGKIEDSLVYSLLKKEYLK